MKNIKKKIRICIIIACIYVIVMLCKGIYWYYTLDGMNVPIIVSTQYSPIPTAVEVYIDQQLVFKNDSLQTLYVWQRTHFSCGVHKLTAIIDGKEFVRRFIVFPVRWIYIEIEKDDNPNSNGKVFIEFSFSPIGLM